MKNTTLFILLSIALCFAACNDDDENLSPTGETNWLVLEDSDDEVDHLAYEIYRDYGIPIYYNDTIARIPVGKKADGEVVYRYELLGVNYHVSVTTNYKYDLLKDREQIKAGMEFLRDNVMPKLLNNMAPRSYFLTESFEDNTNKDKKLIVDVYKARKTTCVKWDADVDKKNREAAILAVEYAAYLVETESETLTAFYDCSAGIQNNKEVLLYGKTLSWKEKDKTSWDPEWRKFGFLSYDPAKGYTAGDRNGSWVAPSKLADLEAYAKYVLLDDYEVFEADGHANYGKCVQKYDLMKKMITDLQETLGKRQKK